ncbi:hypothetical protein REPUB_Repub07fG0200300 [Reevesia pubescens]
MKLITWNIRGLGRREKRRAVRNVVISIKPDMIFLQETKREEVDRRIIRSVWGSNTDCFESSSAVGAAGGLISIWKDDFFLLQSKVITQRYILLVGRIKIVNFLCGFGNIYAPNDDGDRAYLWKELTEVLNSLDVAWCLGGDFNVVRFPWEKLGRSFNMGAMKLFSNFIEGLGFVDFPLIGGKFTWSSNREEATYCRLDRFLVSGSCVEKFGNLSQKSLPRSLSDHNPIVLSVEDKDWGPKPFRFFNHWLDIEGFSDVVINKWCVGGGLNLWHNLKNLKLAIKDWQKKKGLSNFSKIKSLEEEIEKLEEDWLMGVAEFGDRDNIAEKKKELWSLYKLEEKSWQQKSRTKWFLEGDKNTKFFHLTTLVRRRSNTIESLQLADRVVDRPVEVKEVIAEHFNLHFNQKVAVDIEDLDCAFFERFWLKLCIITGRVASVRVTALRVSIEAAVCSTKLFVLAFLLSALHPL